MKPELYYFGNSTILSVIITLWLFSYLFFNDVSGIKNAATWGFIGIFLFLLLILIDLFYCSFLKIMPSNMISINYINDLTNDSSIQCITCIILSFSFQTYAVSIYECLKEKNEKSMIITTSVGIFISMMIYLLVGSVGYLIYENNVNEYFILYSKNVTVIGMFEIIAYILNVLMSFPLTFFALRYYWIMFIKINYTLLRNKITGIDTLHHVNHDFDLNNENEQEEHKNNEGIIYLIFYFLLDHLDNDKGIHNNNDSLLENKEETNQDDSNISHNPSDDKDGYVIISPFLEKLLTFILFLGIIILGNKFQELKLVI